MIKIKKVNGTKVSNDWYEEIKFYDFNKPINESNLENFTEFYSISLE